MYTFVCLVAFFIEGKRIITTTFSVKIYNCVCLCVCVCDTKKMFTVGQALCHPVFSTTGNEPGWIQYI